MPIGPLTYRLIKGSGLTPAEWDNNVHTIEDFVNALEETLGTSLNSDGTLRRPLVVRGASTNGTDAYACSLDGSYAMAADLAGLIIVLHVDVASSPGGATDYPTLTINGTIGPLDIRKYAGGMSAAAILPGFGDIRINQECILTYDPVNACLMLHNPTSNSRENFAPAAIVALATAAYTITLPDLITYTFEIPQAYYAGYKVAFIPATSHTSASEPTLKIAVGSPAIDLTAKTIKKRGGTSCVAGDLIAGHIYEVVYDGTNWQLLNPEIAVPFTATFSEKQTNGTDGGTFTTGAWRTRLLNRTDHNGIPNASLASNQITLPPGTYRIRGFAVGGASSDGSVELHQTRLRNISAGTTLVIGSAVRSITNCEATSIINGRFTLALASVVELQHQCSNTLATLGFGRDMAGFASAEVNVYSLVEIVAEG